MKYIKKLIISFWNVNVIDKYNNYLWQCHISLYFKALLNKSGVSKEVLLKYMPDDKLFVDVD